MRKLLDLVGQAIGKLHAGNLLHGDLTTSNIMLFKEGPIDHTSIYLIDFGLSAQSHLPEDKAVDLYVLEKAFICSHPTYEYDFSFILDGYRKTADKSVEIIKRLDKVRARGRKKIAFG